jgi:hypothetical protein
MNRTALITGGLSLVAASTLALSSPVLAYTPSQNNSNDNTNTQQGTGGQTITDTATFKDSNGQGVAGASVTFSQQSGPSGCQVVFNPATAVTDANGQATSQVTLPANCAGQYVLAASTGGTTVTTTVRETGGFPNTTAEAPVGGSSGFPVAIAAMLAGLCLMVAGVGGTLLRRR